MNQSVYLTKKFCQLKINLKKKLSPLSLLFKMFCLILSFMNEAGRMLQGSFSLDEMSKYSCNLSFKELSS